MLEKIKKTVFKNYWIDEKKWAFFSWYEANWKLLFSHGVLDTDKDLEKVLENLYYNYVDKQKENIKILLCEIVSSIIELTDNQEILSKSPKEFWFALISVESWKSWVILPDTQWVIDAKSALFQIQQRYSLDSKVKVFVFKTDKIQINF